MIHYIYLGFNFGNSKITSKRILLLLYSIFYYFYSGAVDLLYILYAVILAWFCPCFRGWFWPKRRSNSIPWCISFHVILSLRTRHIMISNLQNLQHARNEHGSAPCGWFPNMFLFSSICFCEYQVSLYSLCFKGEFQRRVLVYMCARSQPNTKYKTRRLIRFTRRTETMPDLKSGSNKTAAALWS